MKIFPKQKQARRIGLVSIPSRHPLRKRTRVAPHRGVKGDSPLRIVKDELPVKQSVDNAL